MQKDSINLGRWARLELQVRASGPDDEEFVLFADNLLKEAVQTIFRGSGEICGVLQKTASWSGTTRVVSDESPVQLGGNDVCFQLTLTADVAYSRLPIRNHLNDLLAQKVVPIAAAALAEIDSLADFGHPVDPEFEDTDEAEATFLVLGGRSAH